MRPASNERKKSAKNLIWSFSPWVAFLVGVRFGSVYWGAAIGVAVALVVLARAISRHRVHLFDVVGAAYFAGLLAVLAALHPATSRPGDAMPRR